MGTFNGTEQDLLKTRVCDLPLSMSSQIQKCVQTLYEELDRVGVRMRPPVYLGDEWFSPEGDVAISVPFVFADPRLMKLEKATMLELEGETLSYFMKLLRHEAGHCFDHAFNLSTGNQKEEWSTHFGSPDKPYHPDAYRPQHYSRKFVKNLDGHYAQSHPDEDFAETFAVFIDPQSQWRSRYAHRPIALSKLHYIKKVVNKWGKRRVTYPSPPYYHAYEQLNVSVGDYLRKKKREYGHLCLDYFDAGLLKVFPQKGMGQKSGRVEDFFRLQHSRFMHTLDGRYRRYLVGNLLKRLKRRAKQLELRKSSGVRVYWKPLVEFMEELLDNFHRTGRWDGRHIRE